MKRTVRYLSSLLLSVCSATIINAQCDPVITPATITLCPNETDTLWSDAHDTYQWMKDGTPISGANSQYIVVDANNDVGSLFSVITTTTGCTGPDTSADVLVDGWMFLLPYVVNVTNTMLCPGVPDSVVFDFSLDSNVQWYFNGNPIPGATNDTLVAYNTGFYTAEGAPSVCPNYIMQLGLQLSVDSNVPPVIAPDSLELCLGSMGTLATTLVTYDSFQWYLNGQQVLNSNTASFLASIDGYYHVVTDEDGCILASDSAYVYFHTNITPVITLVGNDLVSVPGGSQLSNFQWYLNGVAIQGANDSLYTPTASGSYTVSASDGTCDDTSAAYQHTVSVNEVKANRSFRLYPNPSPGEVFITSTEAVSVTVMDNIGRVVYRIAATGKSHHLQLQHLSKGIYTINLAGEKGSVFEKIVLE
ncbi:MAG: T9SS type A sorting domain-containing protein [Flavipsychrobacter sp.]|nr:T9SS type A sorting domain-containing protein [Flavipsychrobacter sp.]